MVSTSQIKRFARTIILSFLFGIPIWLLGSVFGVIFGLKKTITTPKIRYVIFDLGDVLLKQNKASQYANIGIGNILLYGMTLHNPMKLKNKMENIADQIHPIEDETLNARTQNGSRPLSQLFRDWLSGKYSGQKSLEFATKFIEAHPEQFINKAERKSIKGIFKFAFTPKTLANMLRPVKAGIKFVQECKDQGFEVLILSNMDSGTYEALEENYPELFSLFEEKNIFISGDIGLIKPDYKIFQTVLSVRRINPEACVFFDDQQENVNAALACGINAIHCPKKKKLFGYTPNIDHLREQLAIVIAQQKQEETTKKAQTIQA